MHTEKTSYDTVQDTREYRHVKQQTRNLTDALKTSSESRIGRLGHSAGIETHPETDLPTSEKSTQTPTLQIRVTEKEFGETNEKLYEIQPPIDSDDESDFSIETESEYEPDYDQVKTSEPFNQEINLEEVKERRRYQTS